MLNIAKKIYVGWGSQGTGLQEAEVIPQGDSANEKRKIASFKTRWTTIKDFDNVPLPGFTLQKSSRRSWSSAEISWLVIDPRGFTVRISSKNLEDLLHDTGVTECLIQQRCVWAREDSQTRMTLVPITADDYDVAVQNTKLIEDKISISDVQIGDTVMLQNELVGTYLGSLSLYGRIESNSVTKETFKASARIRRQVVEVEPGRYHSQVDVKILKVVDRAKTTMTKEEAAERINKEIANQNSLFIAHDRFPSGSASIASTIRAYRGTYKFVSANAVPKVDMSFKEVTLEEAKTHFQLCADDRDPGLVLQDHYDKYFMPDMPFYSSNLTPKAFHTLQLVDFDPKENYKELVTVGQKQNSYYHRSDSLPTFSLDKFKKFYIIVRHVKNNTYI